jgi:hypothetical protein
MTLPVGAWMELRECITKLYLEYRSPDLQEVLEWLSAGYDPFRTFDKEERDGQGSDKDQV